MKRTLGSPGSTASGLFGTGRRQMVAVAGALAPASRILWLTAALVPLATTSFADGQFSSLATTVQSTVSNIMRALLIIGGAVIGGKAMLGSHETGKHVTWYLIGAAFAIFAGTSTRLWDAATSLFGGN